MKYVQIKHNIQQALFKKLETINNVISVTIVGSFVDRNDLSGISDIDTIVITNSLNKELFDACLNAVEDINLKKCGLDNYTLKINPTFGPLKFDKPDLAIIHLMIYDINSHKRHVIASPFTCYDWERSKTKIGLSLKEIFPVGVLQFRDFMEVRRSLENYIDDLDSNVISYREYNFISDKISEIKKKKPLDSRHCGEYSYHIIRNLVINYLKLCNKKNDSYSLNDVKKEIDRIFSEKSDLYKKKFDMIATIKGKRETSFPKNTIKWTKNFITEFQQSIKEEWSNAVPINFVRHYQTKLNNGTFLGQGRNPGIDKSITSYPKYKPLSNIFSSPMRRCIETAKIFSKEFEIKTDDRLLEFNYGSAEGLNYDELVTQYPKILPNWQKGKDPSFPGGENTLDVHNRLKSFLEDLAKEIDTSNSKVPKYIVTHNGILRCLLGNAFGLKQKEWYLLVIPHGIALEFLYHENHFHPNIPRKLLSEIMQNIGYSVA